MRLIPFDEGYAPLGLHDLEGRVVVITVFDPGCIARDVRDRGRERGGERVGERVLRCHLALQSVEEIVNWFRYAPAANAGREHVLGAFVLGTPQRDPDLGARYRAWAFLRRHGLTLPAYWDQQGWLASQLPGTGLGTHVFDREGRRVFTRSGALPFSARAETELRDAIQAALDDDDGSY
jgi:hypothetical protein